MMRWRVLLTVALLLVAWLWGESHGPRSASTPATSDAASAATLPPEAHDTLQRIQRGGPFRHRQDGATFQNRERRLPQRARGHYREYTVQTPGSDDRGARRIVTGGGKPPDIPPTEFWYTDDHYRSFRKVQP